MKKLIFLFIPLLTFGQNFNTKFKTDSLEYRIDSTNTLLNQFTFVGCGENIPSGDALLVKVCEPLSVSTDTAINATIREMRDSIARQNIILMNQSTPTITSVTPSYTTNRTLLTANTTPAPYSVSIPTDTREITIQNITGTDIQITTLQGTQILATRNNLTLSNPINTTINHAVFTGNITITFLSSVLGNISGVQPRVIVNFKAY